jgi:hypothetical protein
VLLLASLPLISFATSVFAQALIISPNPIAFGNIVVSTTSTQTATINNLNSSSVSVLSISLSNGAGFSRTGGTCPSNFPATIAGGTSCTVVISFTAPANAGPTGTRLEVVADTGNVFVPISATVIQAGVAPTLSPAVVNFGLSPVDGAIQPTRVITLNNPGTTALQLLGFSAAPIALEVMAARGYRLTSRGTCMGGVSGIDLIAVVPAGGACTLEVQLAGFNAGGQVAAGNYDSTLTISTGAGNITANLVGKRGDLIYPILVNPSNIILTRATTQSASSVASITLSNPAPITVNIADITVPAPFRRVGGSCPSSFPVSLPPGAGCTVDIQVPAGAGSESRGDQSKAVVIVAATAPIIADTGNVGMGLTLRTGADEPLAPATPVPLGPFAPVAAMLAAFAAIRLRSRN